MAASIPNRLTRSFTRRTTLATCLAFPIAGWSQGSWRSLSLPPSGTVTVLHAAGEILLAGTSQGRIFTSGDGGRNWTPSLVTGGAPATAIRSSGSDLYAGFGNAGLDPMDCAPGFPCTFPSRQGGLFRSEDQGKTWTAVGQQGNGVSALTLVGSDVYFANGGGVYRSAGGASSSVLITRLYGGLPLAGIPLVRVFISMEWMGTSLLALSAGDGTPDRSGTLFRGTPSGDTLRWSLVRDTVLAMARLGTAVIICKEGTAPARGLLPPCPGGKCRLPPRRRGGNASHPSLGFRWAGLERFLRRPT